QAASRVVPAARPLRARKLFRRICTSSPLNRGAAASRGGARCLNTRSRTPPCARMRKNLQVSIRPRATTRAVWEGEGMARLIDIARAAGVSEATVSRVLNGKAGVNEATRQAVRDVARRLGRDLGPEAIGSGPLVGVLVPDLDNQVFAAWAERIEAELFERGASTLVGMRARTVEREREILQRFLHCGVEAIIVVSGHHAQHRGPVEHYREI